MIEVTENPIETGKIYEPWDPRVREDDGLCAWRLLRLRSLPRNVRRLYPPVRKIKL